MPAAPEIQKRRDMLRDGIQCPDLTGRQAEVLRYILECWLSGFIPTMRGICEEFGWTSPNAAYEHLERLKSKGYIEELGEKTSLMLSDKALELVL